MSTIAVCSEVTKNSLFLYAYSEDSDKSKLMPRLIRISQ